jgi:hypothetical protein
MPVERRGRSSLLDRVNQQWEEPNRQWRAACDGTSRMNREVHVRNLREARVKFPGPTRHSRQRRASSKSGQIRYATESGSKFRALAAQRPKSWRVDGRCPSRDSSSETGGGGFEHGWSLWRGNVARQAASYLFHNACGVVHSGAVSAPGGGASRASTNSASSMT